jgi:hypothetical protein
VTPEKHLEEFESNDSKFVAHKSEVVQVEAAGEPDHNWIPNTADVFMTQRIERDGDKFKAFEPIVKLGGGVDEGFVLNHAVNLAHVLVTFAERSAEWANTDEGRSAMEEI